MVKKITRENFRRLEAKAFTCRSFAVVSLRALAKPACPRHRQLAGRQTFKRIACLPAGRLHPAPPLTGLSSPARGFSREAAGRAQGHRESIQTRKS